MSGYCEAESDDVVAYRGKLNKMMKSISDCVRDFRMNRQRCFFVGANLKDSLMLKNKLITTKYDIIIKYIMSKKDEVNDITHMKIVLTITALVLISLVALFIVKKILPAIERNQNMKVYMQEGYIEQDAMKYLEER